MGAQAGAEGRSITRRRGEGLGRSLRPFSTLIFVSLIFLQLLPVRAFAQEDLKVSYEKAQQLFEQGKGEDAAEAFRSLLAQTYQDRAVLYQQEGLLKDAAGDLTAALSLAPDSRRIQYELAYTEFRLQRYAEAASMLEQVVRATPNDPRAHALLGKTYLSLKKNQAARHEFQIASRLNPGEQDAAHTLAPAPPAPLTDRQKKLLSVYEQVLVSGHNYLARIAVSEGKFDDAARQFTQVRNLQPDNPEVDYRLGLAFYKAGQFAQAVKPFEEAVARNPGDASAAKYLGLTFFELGRYDEAVKTLQQARSSAPNDPEVLLALGGALARTRHDKEAQNIMAELLKSHPDSAAVHILLGKAYAAQGQAPQAEQEFRRALELNPQAPSAHLYLGTLMLQNGRMTEAGEEFKAELQNRPAAFEARYDLAFVLLKQQKIAEAVPLLRQVIQEQPGYAEAHYSLGKALLDQGNVREAISELKKAVQLDPGKAYSHYQLGRAFLQAGQRKEAQEEFELTRNLKDQQLKFPAPQPGSTP